MTETEDLIELTDTEAQVWAHRQVTRALGDRERRLLPRLSQASVSKIASHLPLPRAVFTMAHGLGVEVILDERALARRKANAAAKQLRQLADDLEGYANGWDNVQATYDPRKLFTSAHARRKFAVSRMASDLGNETYRIVAAKRLRELADSLESADFSDLGLKSLGYAGNLSDNRVEFI